MTDKGTPAKSSTEDCQIIINDVNDVTPTFVFPEQGKIIYTNDVSMRTEIVIALSTEEQ